MAQAEQPRRQAPGYRVSIDDVRQLMGASTPHFALQIRNRLVKLIADLPEDDPARRLAMTEIARLERLAFTGETRGEQGLGEKALRANNADAPIRKVPGARSPFGGHVQP
jgi:hypothetical protein